LFDNGSMSYLKIFSCLLVAVFSSVSYAHDGHRFFRDYENKIYSGYGSAHFDGKSRLCYKRFFVPTKQSYYDFHFLPTHCNEKTLTVGHPALRLPKAPEIPKIKVMRLHSEIHRELPDGSLEFAKIVIKGFFDLAKRVKRGFHEQVHSQAPWNQKD